MSSVTDSQYRPVTDLQHKESNESNFLKEPNMATWNAMTTNEKVLYGCKAAGVVGGLVAGVGSSLGTLLGVGASTGVIWAITLIPTSIIVKSIQGGYNFKSIFNVACIATTILVGGVSLMAFKGLTFSAAVIVSTQMFAAIFIPLTVLIYYNQKKERPTLSATATAVPASSMLSPSLTEPD